MDQFDRVPSLSDEFLHTLVVELNASSEQLWDEHYLL